MLTKQHLLKVDGNILLIGETGTGKSHLSKWIHKNSHRKDLLYFQVNLPSLSKNLFESELFGHKKGSFTGASENKIGFCEKVGRGTLFFDEIGDLHLSQQKILLTLLEEKIFYPVGSSQIKSFRGSFIFATNKDLEKEVEKGKFRQDLYHRLRSYTYHLTPLRKREDKRTLIFEELSKSKLEHNKRDLTLTREVRDFLGNYDFPGNYRELKQIMDYICFTATNVIGEENLPNWCLKSSLTREKEKVGDSYYNALEVFEKRFLQEKLKKYQGRINYTAQMIEISKVTLISKVKKYGINVLEYKLANQYTVSRYGF